MNKRDAQQHLVAYKDNQREKEYALQHGVLSNFKAKYLEKIPLGNGKFRYIYEEAKDKVSSAAKNVANTVKSTVNPGAMTSNEKSVRTSSAQARTDVKNQQEADARKAALEEINRRATQNAQSPNAADARMQFAKQAVAENQNKVDYLNKQKNAKPTGANRADKIESQRDDDSGRTENKEANKKETESKEANKKETESKEANKKETESKEQKAKQSFEEAYKAEQNSNRYSMKNGKIEKPDNEQMKKYAANNIVSDYLYADKDFAKIYADVSKKYEDVTEMPKNELKQYINSIEKVLKKCKDHFIGTTNQMTPEQKLILDAINENLKGIEIYK